MVNTIIEKLGITPEPWVIDGHNINYINDPDWFYRICQISPHNKFPNNTQLIAAAPEMLEALIEAYKVLEFSENSSYFNDMKKAIEKAIGLPWNKIKEAT